MTISTKVFKLYVVQFVFFFFVVIGQDPGQADVAANAELEKKRSIRLRRLLEHKKPHGVFRSVGRR